jgi:MCM P-loop domain
MFSNSIKYEFKEEITITEDDKKTFERFAGLPEVTERLVSMFAPNVVGENIKKLALLRSIVNAAADKVKPKGSDWSSIVSTIMIGDMGNAKTMLAKETVKVLPNSRYAGSQNSTGLSLTGMIDVENDIKIIRYGPIPLSKYAISEVQPLGFKGDFGPVSYEVVEHRRRSRRTNSFEPTEDPIPLLNGKPDKDLENLLSEHNGILVSVTDDNTEIEEEY